MFRLLGPVEAVAGDRPVDLGTPKQRIVLAVLLAEAGRPVVVDVLIDRAWDEAPAGAVRRTLSTYVSRLRRALDEVRAAGGEVELVRRPGGYELRVDPDLVDVHRFGRLVADAEDQSRPAADRVALLRAALDLWQGEALADLPGEWARRMRQIWNLRRLDATVAWARLELGLGHAKPVIGAVRELVTEHPLAEPLAEVLIRALHQDGRTAEALEFFGATRRRLVDELGVEPGAELRAAHEAALGGTPARPDRQLPADIADFVGRTGELATIREVLLRPGPRLVAISGPPGVGKTALAVRIGHLLAPSFPDGQLFAALQGVSADPADVFAQLLRGLGIDGSALPAGVDARAALFRSRLAGRRLLLILDNAGGHHQVEPLLAGTAVVVTSRSPLTGLPGVTTVDLSPLPGPAAIELLGRVAGPNRVRAEPDGAADLVTLCGGLPLAVRIVAARLAARPYWTIATLSRRLSDERRLLDELRHGDLAVRPGLQVAYQGLTPAAARAFALLGKLDVASFPEWVVAALLDTAPPSGASALEELVDARLLDELGPDAAGQPRYRFHEVTRAFAREAELGAPEWRSALARAAAGWLFLARRARDGLQCERMHLDDGFSDGPSDRSLGDSPSVAAERPVDWFEAERDVLAVLVSACAEAGLAATARDLAACAADFYGMRAYYNDWLRTTEVAMAACRASGDTIGAAAMLRSLGICQVDLDDLALALETLRAARSAAEQVGDAAGAALARKYIGFVLGLTGRLDESTSELRAAATELRHVGTQANEAMALANLAFVMRQTGDTAAAVRTSRSALAIARACGDLFAQAYVSRGLAAAELDAGRVHDAERAARRAAALFSQIGDPIGAAQSLRAVGEALAHDPHQTAAAEQALAEAAAILRDKGHNWGLALVELSLGEIEVRRAEPGAVDRLRRTLQFWTDENIPLLQARTLVALGAAATHAGDPSARDLLLRAYHLYRDRNAPQAADLAARLGLPDTAALA